MKTVTSGGLLLTIWFM